MNPDLTPELVAQFLGSSRFSFFSELRGADRFLKDIQHPMSLANEAAFPDGCRLTPEFSRFSSDLGNAAVQTIGVRMFLFDAIHPGVKDFLYQCAKAAFWAKVEKRRAQSLKDSQEREAHTEKES